MSSPRKRRMLHSSAMHILVTGSSGTIGTRLSELLLQQGHMVTGVDWLENKWQSSIQSLTKIVDLRDGKAVHSTLKETAEKKPIDAIVHLGANARVYELVEHPDRAMDNFITLFNTLEFARKHEIKKFIFASSRESYGNIRAEKYTEDLVRVENCESPYTASKVGGEALVESYSRCYGIDHITFRFSNVYGMYDDSVRVVPLFIRLARANQDITVFGEEKCLDFTYIDDTVSGIIAGIEKFESVKNTTYNLAYGEGTTILALAKKVIELLKSNSKIVMGKPRTGEVIRYIADITKAQKSLGYMPKTNFDEGIRKAVEWYLQYT